MKPPKEFVKWLARRVGYWRSRVIASQNSSLRRRLFSQEKYYEALSILRTMNRQEW